MYIKDDENGMENLKLFIEKWEGKALPEYGMLDEEVPRFLPKPLRDLYLFSGKWPHPRKKDVGYSDPYGDQKIFDNQDFLVEVESLEKKNGRVTFLFENQGNWTCEIEANNDNSPVYSDAAEVWDENASGHEIVCESLSNFLITYCLQELVFGSRYVGTIEDKLKMEQILKNSEPLWLEGFYVNKEPDHSFYIYNHKLLIMDYGGLWYACNDESALALIV